MFYNRVNFFTKVANKITRTLRIKLRNGFIKDGTESYEVYWGSAQWALTGECANYVLSFYKTHKQFNKWFEHAFPTDELYVNTVVMNSPYRTLTQNGGPEKAKEGLVNWRNLHYFEYLPGEIKKLTMDDYEMLTNLSQELYIRKVNSKESTELLDKLDSLNV